MGLLIDKIKLSLLVHGKDVPDNFKNNSLFFFDLYSKSTEDFKNINIRDISQGGFYFFQYLDTSGWMRWSPVFVADVRKFSNKIIVLAVNFNFIPLEVRGLIFDKFIADRDFDSNKYLKVDYNGMYDALKDIGFEYTLMEYDASNIKIVHRVSLNLLPRFLYHQHPKNVYDPKKLIDIWQKKLETKDERHREMTLSILSDFYDINKEISENYNVLKNHIKRIHNNIKKWG
jgi:hypothetical protein